MDGFCHKRVKEHLQYSQDFFIIDNRSACLSGHDLRFDSATNGSQDLVRFADTEHARHTSRAEASKVFHGLVRGIRIAEDHQVSILSTACRLRLFQILDQVMPFTFGPVDDGLLLHLLWIFAIGRLRI